MCMKFKRPVVISTSWYLILITDLCYILDMPQNTPIHGNWLESPQDGEYKILNIFWAQQN